MCRENAIPSFARTSLSSLSRQYFSLSSSRSTPLAIRLSLNSTRPVDLSFSPIRQLLVKEQCRGRRV